MVRCHRSTVSSIDLYPAAYKNVFFVCSLAIRQAISKSLVAYYQKCKSMHECTLNMLWLLTFVVPVCVMYSTSITILSGSACTIDSVFMR